MSSLEEQYEAIDLPRIKRFVADHEQEDLHLEFKTLKNDFDDPDDRKNLSKAISGFANSDGGIVVWGIYAAKGEDDVDAAQKLRPIEDLAKAHAQAQFYTGKAATPLVDRVRHRPVPQAHGKGFLLTFVPASDSGPHMAELAGHHYYKRAGDSFYRMEHFDLADMFGRRPKPKLSLYTKVVPGARRRGPGGATDEILIRIGIRNTGKGMARFPFLRLVRPPPPFRLLPLTSVSGPLALPTVRPPWEDADAMRYAIYAGCADHVVYAGAESPVTTISVQVPPRTLPPHDLHLVSTLGAEGVPFVKDTKIFTREELLDVLLEK